jgi:anaerobic selenocysteine-containing dehydrogenase
VNEVRALPAGQDQKEAEVSAQTVRTYCSLCGVGCPSAVTVEGDRVLSLSADRQHPHGGLMCPKGRAAPEMHDHPHRVNHPLRRTRPKAATDPGWERCSWDEALELVATALDRIRRESGPEAVAVARGTGSGTGLAPTEPWVKRFADAFGTPNYVTNTHLCNWARDGAAHHTFGVFLPPPDVERSGCIVVWGANPQATRINLASDITAALKRGARLVVVDPRRTGLAGRADLVLQVRPGTDGALALALIHLLIEKGWYDDGFVRDWTNAPLLVRDDTGQLLRSDELHPLTLSRVALTRESSFGERGYVALAETTARLVEYLPSQRRYAGTTRSLALRGSAIAELADGSRVRCRPVFELLARLAEDHEPGRAATITGVPEPLIHEAAWLIADNRPVSHHVWNGIVQHTNATQAGRAIEVLYALVGDWDRPGGNVLLPPPTTGSFSGAVRLPEERAAVRLGRDERPLGPPAVVGQIAAYDVFAAVLEAHPYRVRGLVSFGSNTLLNAGDPRRGREALRNLEFFVQAELFHTPTSALADVLLPAAGFLESDQLIVTGAGRAEPRRRSVAPLHERRPDVAIVFDLASRLGLGEHFAGGDVQRAYDEVLAPAGLSWRRLLDQPEGVDVLPEIRYEKHAAPGDDGRLRGFPTPSGKVELFAESFAAHGQPPLPVYEEPAQSPARTPDLAREYPLVLTNAKRSRYLHSQHRGVASLRRRAQDPTVEVHPDTAARFDVADGAWVTIETPRARVRSRAKLTDAIVPGVVCATHGWWEACEELGLAELDPFGETGANVNLLVHNDVRDPIGGGVPHRSSLCRLSPAGSPEP